VNISCSFYFCPTDVAELRKAFSRIVNRNSSGYDGVSMFENLSEPALFAPKVVFDGSNWFTEQLRADGGRCLCRDKPDSKVLCLGYTRHCIPG